MPGAVPWLLRNSELSNVTPPFVSDGSITRYNDKNNQIESIRESRESRLRKIEIKSNRVAVRISNFLVTTQPKKSICTAISSQYSHLVWHTKSLGLHRAGLSKGLRSPWHVELLQWAGLGRRGTGFHWRAGLRFSSSLGHWVWMWLGYHWCRCWSPKWGWKGMLQIFFGWTLLWQYVVPLASTS